PETRSTRSRDAALSGVQTARAIGHSGPLPWWPAAVVAGGDRERSGRCRGTGECGICAERTEASGAQEALSGQIRVGIAGQASSVLKTVKSFRGFVGSNPTPSAASSEDPRLPGTTPGGRGSSPTRRGADAEPSVPRPPGAKPHLQ